MKRASREREGVKRTKIAERKNERNVKKKKNYLEWHLNLLLASNLFYLAPRALSISIKALPANGAF